MTTKLLIVEDHPIYAEALQLAVTSSMDNTSVTCAYTIAEALRVLAGSQRFDLALLDLWLPDSQSLTGLLELRVCFPNLPVIVVSASDHDSLVHASLLCGAAGFVSKAESKKVLVEAIHSVLAGDQVIPGGSPGPQTELSPNLDGAIRKVMSLSRQELRVLKLIHQGYLNKQIAHELEITESTAKAHSSQVLKKLDVINRTAAAIEIAKLDLRSIVGLLETGIYQTDPSAIGFSEDPA
jgi:DNA-binding NarL/FixJ family response regulator